MQKFKKTIGILLMIIVFSSAFIIPQTSQAKTTSSVKLNKKSIVLYVGKTYKLKLSGTKSKIKWSSSKKSIATVSSKGVVKAKNAGKATITAKLGKKKYNCKVIVKKKKTVLPEQTQTTQSEQPIFIKLYNKYCINIPECAKVGSDGSYLSLDTNHYDIKHSYYYIDPVDTAIQNINRELGIPESVYQRMLHTNALQGRQTATYGKYSVSWTYHPDNGLEVIYELVY